MCVVAFALNLHPQWRLVLAANRDEIHSRPSAALARWPGADSHIIAGRDLQSGGSWLGVSENGHVAVVTNIRTGALPDPAKKSRGDLVTGSLRGKRSAEMGDLCAYNPFSLLEFGPDGAVFSANRPASMAIPLPDGIHGLSNGVPGENWPRMDRLKAKLAGCLNSPALAETLFSLLADESEEDGIFIRDAHYGTRCSTVLLLDHAGQGTIIERRFQPEGIASGSTEIAFRFRAERMV